MIKFVVRNLNEIQSTIVIDLVVGDLPPSSRRRQLQLGPLEAWRTPQRRTPQYVGQLQTDTATRGKNSVQVKQACQMTLIKRHFECNFCLLAGD